MNSDYFTESNLIKNSVKSSFSSSKGYKIELREYNTGEKSWNYSRGIITKEGQEIADVKRNYPRFPFTWVEDHPSGHDYLICGENYMGQTIVELDTGKKINFVAKNAKEGYGFCWIKHFPSPNKRMLAVEGCYWGAPRDLVIFDFEEPRNLPYKEIAHFHQLEKFSGWNVDNSLETTIMKFARKSDGKFCEDLTEEEEDRIDKGLDEEGERAITLEWTLEHKINLLKMRWND